VRERGPAASADARSGNTGAGRFEAAPGIVVYTEGDALYSDMLAAIRSARERVWLETYILELDGVGRRFLAALRASARRGVDVRLHLDAVGSFGVPKRRTRRALRAAGVRLQRFRTWRWYLPGSYHRRDHRKLLVVDDTAAYLGGFNITARNSRRRLGDERWRDTHLRMTGPLVDDARRAFAAFADRDPGWPPDRGGDVHLLPNHGRTCRYRLRCTLHDWFRSASHRIWLTTPYFVPDSGTRRHLVEAVRRGVDVRLLLPARSDVRIARWAAHAAYAWLLCNGVRIFEYDSRMLHAKTIVVDGTRSTVGTANLDYRSLFQNFELNLVAESRSLNATLTGIFQRDLCHASEIRPRAWMRRPWPARIAEKVAWMARRWL
jgi:cardiolipin synthase